MPKSLLEMLGFSSQSRSQPADAHGYTPNYQSWHEYNKTTSEWEPVPNASETSPPSNQQETPTHDTPLTVATWNVDMGAPLPTDRLSAMFSRMVDHAPSPDIIFLQEVIKPMVAPLLSDERVREGWYSSERDTRIWGGHLYATMVLVSKSRFGHLGKAAFGVLGRVSRINYRSRYGRDALCSELLIPSAQQTTTKQPTYKRLLLVNVHLDSLPVKPSHRPHQLSVISSLLHDYGHGLVAGDFNPVLPEDETLVEENKLVDAWKQVKGDDPGYTWGLDGANWERFGPGRLDKVAMVGLKALHVEVMHPEDIPLPGPGNAGEEKSDAEPQTVRWSDHSGLKCTFAIVEDA